MKIYFTHWVDKHLQSYKTKQKSFNQNKTIEGRFLLETKTCEIKLHFYAILNFNIRLNFITTVRKIVLKINFQLKLKLIDAF